jgi:hypothetical protein
MKEKKIWCENSIDRIWGLYLFFENEPNAKKHLFESYIQSEEEKDANRLAFENTHKFIYFLKQGVSYFKSAQQSELIVRPLLLYYGCTSLMKAIILLKDPHYPRTTTILQHGITTRKRKKSNYVFHEDEIKVQKHGLLPHFAQVVLDQPLVIHQKYKVFDLLSLLPELQDSFELVFTERTMSLLRINKMDSSLQISFNSSMPEHEIDSQSFINLMQEGLINETFRLADQGKYRLDITYGSTEGIQEWDIENSHTQILRDYKGNYYFYFKNSVDISNEIIIYNMLMYILGMLCRYDTELWGELLFTFNSNDMYIIEEFLQLSLRKFPNLILNYLFDETLIFES